MYKEKISSTCMKSCVECKHFNMKTQRCAIQDVPVWCARAGYCGSDAKLFEKTYEFTPLECIGCRHLEYITDSFSLCHLFKPNTAASARLYEDLCGPNGIGFSGYK